MKKKILITNVDVAAVAAFGGLTVMPMFPIFFQMHGFYFSAVAFVITLWGLLSLKQLDTPEPKKKRWKKVGTTTALILFLSGGLLFGTLDAT